MANTPTSALGGALSYAASGLKNKYQSASNSANNFVSNFGKEFQDFSKNYNAQQQTASNTANKFLDSVRIGLKQALNAPVEAVKDLPIQNAIDSRKNYIKTRKFISLADQKKMDEKANAAFIKLGGNNGNADRVWDMMYGEPPTTSGTSADLNGVWKSPNYYEQQPSDPKLEELRQKVINSPNLRPKVKELYSKIPLQEFNDMREQGMYSGNPMYPGITIRTTQPEIKGDVVVPKDFKGTQEDYKKQLHRENLEQVLQHELLHATPELIPLETYKPTNKKLIDSFTKQWGKDYMKRPGALVGEMFAESKLPPAYYWHIFKNVIPDATPKNFIDSIRTVFSDPKFSLE